MTIQSKKYKIMWDRLSLFRTTVYAPVYSPMFECEMLAGETKRIFTLWPPWLWDRLRYTL